MMIMRSYDMMGFLTDSIDDLDIRMKQFFMQCKKAKPEWKEQQYNQIREVKDVSFTSSIPARPSGAWISFALLGWENHKLINKLITVSIFSYCVRDGVQGNALTWGSKLGKYFSCISYLEMMFE